MTHVTCRLTAKNRDQLLNPTRKSSMGYLYHLLRCQLTQVDLYIMAVKLWLLALVYVTLRRLNFNLAPSVVDTIT